MGGWLNVAWNEGAVLVELVQQPGCAVERRLAVGTSVCD